jgi:hypothetical protein
MGKTEFILLSILDEHLTLTEESLVKLSLLQAVSHERSSRWILRMERYVYPWIERTNLGLSITKKGIEALAAQKARVQS